MARTIQKGLSGAFGAASGDREMEALEAVLRPLTDSGFEFRGGDTFGQEIFSIYINDRTDEFVIMRFNRPGGAEPLIHRGAIAELDQPMSRMETLPFVTLGEFLGAKTQDQLPMPVPAARIAAPPRFRPGLN
jgi:hypothetical protein